MALGNEVAVANDPKEEVAEEEEEEEELVDPHNVIREECKQTDACQKYLTKLDECTERVQGRSNTTEHCVDELFDFIHSVDHCVSKKLFSKLK